MDYTNITEFEIPNTGGYDSLSKWYTFLELLLFRNKLAKARIAHINEIKNAKSILILGDGTGRFLLKLLQENPYATILSIDASERMIEKSQQRVSTYMPQAITRVKWIHADALSFDYSKFSFDLIITQFFLDQFNTEKIELIIKSLSEKLPTGGLWYDVDFNIPTGNILGRIRSNLYLKLLYKFFRHYCQIEASSLSNTFLLFRKNLAVKKIKRISNGLLGAYIWEKK